MIKIKRLIIAVCTRLKEKDALPKETVFDVLEGLTKCSVPAFAALFDFYIQMSRATHEREDGAAPDTLALIRKHLHKAVDEYHALCTAGKWHMSGEDQYGFALVH